MFDFDKWALTVLDNEGLSDWTVVPGEAYCWLESKQIMFDFVRYHGNYALWLHEVAHALHPQPEGPLHNHYHGGGWASKYAELVQKYMVPRG